MRKASRVSAAALISILFYSCLRSTLPPTQVAPVETAPAPVKLLGVYCIGSQQHRLEALQKNLRRAKVTEPTHMWLYAEKDDELLAEAAEAIESDLVEPSALPESLCGEWQAAWRSQGHWYPVRRGPEVAGIDLTRESLPRALAHARLWRKLAQEETPGVYLVLDEDCELGCDFSRSALHDCLSGAPDDWEILLLGGFDVMGMLDQYEARNHSGFHQLYPWYRAAGAYLLNTPPGGPIGARTTLQSCTPIRWRPEQELAGWRAAARALWPPKQRVYGAVTLPTTYVAPTLVQGTDLEWPSGSDNDEEHLYKELDAVIAWAMRLTDRPVKKGSRERELEGHSNMVPELAKVMTELASAEGVQTIGEIGFNGGHGTLRWLLHSKARVVSFDLGEHDYGEPASRWLSNKFPGRLEVTWGDSIWTVPDFKKQNPDVKCDLIFIDGGHDYKAALADLEHFASMANPQHHRILMDDTDLSGPKEAWSKLVKEGKITELERFEGQINHGGRYGFIVGNYTALAMA